MYCKKCGSKVTDETIYCTNCGYPTKANDINYSNTAQQKSGKKTSFVKVFAVIIGLFFIIACVTFLFISTDLFSFTPNLKGHTYEGYYVYDDDKTPISFTITFDEHQLMDFSGTIEDDELGEAEFYGRFTGKNEFYFNKTYDSSEHFYIDQYQGTIDYENDVMRGTWTKNDGETQGTFVINMD